MNQNPNENSQRSEIFISYTRQQLQTMDFDPTKPHMYQNQKQGERQQNKEDQYQYNNKANTSLNAYSYQGLQTQNDVMKTEKNLQGTQKQNANQYMTQEEYHQNNLIQKHKITNLSQTTPFTNENWINSQASMQQQNQKEFTFQQNSFQQK